MAYCTQTDLSLAVGGDDKLLQLVDKTGSGNLASASCQAFITDLLEDGAAEVRAAVEVKHDPETVANLDAPSLKRLIEANAALSARLTWEKSSGGIAVPEYIERRAARAEDFLDKLTTGQRRLGRVAGGVAAAINQPAIGALDYDAADALSVSQGGNANPSTTSGRAPSTSGISIAAFRQNGFR